MNVLSYFRIKTASEDDRGTLQILSILQIILGVGGIISSCMMSWMYFSDPTPKPAALKWAIIAMAVYSISLLLSGLSIRKGRLRWFSMIVTGMMCLAFPMGTILGGYTLYVLCSPIGQRVYRDGLK